MKEKKGNPPTDFQLTKVKSQNYRLNKKSQAQRIQARKLKDRNKNNDKIQGKKIK